MTHLRQLTFIALILLAGIVRADSTPWIVPRSIDLARYLAPPPAAGSPGLVR